MSITAHDRKLLWGRSGNRCAVCRRLLVVERTATDRESIVGDECHIISSRPEGPRSEYVGSGDVDGYDNLILLCRVDHKRVDDQPKTYPPHVLRSMKLAHEKWVDLALTLRPPESQEFPGGPEGGTIRLARIREGGSLLATVAGCQGYDLDHDEIQNEAELRLIAPFLQKLHDLGEAFDDIESGGRAQIRYELARDLKTLENSGFVIYGARAPRAITILGSPSRPWIATVRVIRLTNPKIWDPASGRNV